MSRQLNVGTLCYKMLNNEFKKQVSWYFLRQYYIFLILK